MTDRHQGRLIGAFDLSDEDGETLKEEDTSIVAVVIAHTKGLARKTDAAGDHVWTHTFTITDFELIRTPELQDEIIEKLSMDHPGIIVAPAQLTLTPIDPESIVMDVEPKAIIPVHRAEIYEVWDEEEVFSPGGGGVATKTAKTHRPPTEIPPPEAPDPDFRLNEW